MKLKCPSCGHSNTYTPGAPIGTCINPFCALYKASGAEDKLIRQANMPGRGN